MPEVQRVKAGVTPPANAAPSGLAIRCPECLTVREPGRAAGMFCSKDHKTAFNNRQTVRGRVLVPLIMAERITRSGERRDRGVGVAARQDSRRLMDRWAREDRDAGRMAMDDYLRQRRALGVYTFLDLK